MSREDDAHEHMVAGHKAKNDALNTPGASSYARETADHLARAAGHFEKAAAAGHEYGADAAKKAHEGAATNYREAGDKTKAAEHKALAKGEAPKSDAKTWAEARTASKSTGGADDIARDEQGRFASK